jgi:hypothetical protein
LNLNLWILEEVTQMKKMLRAVALAVPFALAAGLASADEPMQLTDNQLDGVSAGALSAAYAHALAAGPNNALAATKTFTASAQIAPSYVVELSRVVPTGSLALSASLAAAN